MCPDATDGLACDECPKQRLQDYLESPQGRLLQVVTDLDFGLERGMRITLEEITYLEFRLLRIFSEERVRWEKEQIKKQSGHS